MKITPGHTTLYRLYGHDDRLLYVGIAGNPGRRFEQHRGDKPWWGEVVRTELEHFPSRRLASEAESQAIHDERPRYNVKGAQGQAIIEHSLIVKCMICDEPIADGDGYLEVDVRRAARVAAAYRELQSSRNTRARGIYLVDLSALQAMPDDAPWRALHVGCDPEPDAGSYCIDVERIRTWQDVLRWSLHLSEKDWQAHTNWDHVMYHLLETGEIAPRWEKDTWEVAQ